jgi:hypothetical protein
MKEHHIHCDNILDRLRQISQILQLLLLLLLPLETSSRTEVVWEQCFSSIAGRAFLTTSY